MEYFSAVYCYTEYVCSRAISHIVLLILSLALFAVIASFLCFSVVVYADCCGS